jgi:hypothetical protein
MGAQVYGYFSTSKTWLATAQARARFCMTMLPSSCGLQIRPPCKHIRVQLSTPSITTHQCDQGSVHETYLESRDSDEAMLWQLCPRACGVHFENSILHNGQAPQQPTIGWLITFSWLVDVIPSDQPKWLVDEVSINQPSGVDEGLMRNPLTAAVGNVYCAIRRHILSFLAI